MLTQDKTLTQVTVFKPMIASLIHNRRYSRSFVLSIDG